MLIVDWIGLAAGWEQIGRALRAFVAEQFRNDEEVKFRQVELANTLLSLFVDIPADVTSLIFGHEARNREDDFQIRLRELTVSGHDSDSFFDDAAEQSGPAFTAYTADLLLDSRFQEGAPWIVLQGAPGQGKSTLAQYICQVHRARYLAKEEFIDALPEGHKSAAFRFPVKVDLRDLASYLDGSSYLGRAPADDEVTRSLEQFLASLISIQSGGLPFEPDDLVVVSGTIPLIFFFDGLDEVADLDLRGKLIAAVAKGLNRLRENGADLQVVVTSRPSLFGREASFGKDFTRLNLTPISRETIDQYAQKWVVARGLNEARSKGVRAILEQKLDLGHVRELTKNPMQLTILLSLIQSIGHSLPNVRTERYHEYVNLFMTREAEKSSVVRDQTIGVSSRSSLGIWLGCSRPARKLIGPLEVLASSSCGN